jgi:hypothetical protein
LTAKRHPDILIFQLKHANTRGEQMTTLQDCLNNAEEALRETWEWNECRYASDVEDDIFEVADGAVPIYNSDLLEVASNSPDMALLAPECGPAFDGTPTPINIIAANIYEAITAELYGVAQALEEEADEREMEEEEEEEEEED